MPQPVYILISLAWTVATSLALGRLLLRHLEVRLYRQEETPLAYVAGSAILSLIVFLLAAAQIFYKGTVLAVGALALLAAWRAGVWKPVESRLPLLPSKIKWAAAIVAAPFLLLTFSHAMAPEMSPDGSAYHLGLVARYYREHGFPRITTNMYANLSQGIEMLFLYAFAFGRHSAAALVHWSYLPALSWMMLSYSRRQGFPKAGAAGALFVLLSPVVGIDAASAYNDVAVAAILFAVFYLVQVWDASRSNSLLVPIGLLAGFAFAAKYTAFLAIPYAFGWVAVRLRDRPRIAFRALATMTACAGIMVIPWLVKNAVVVGNPVSPFFNRWFPNPYIHINFEQEYARQMRSYEGLAGPADIPVEAAVRGQVLCGLVGPLFLLSPLALVALGDRRGRRLLGAALLFGLPYAANVGTRFLIPALPFIALAMALALARWPRVLALLVLAHALLSWPDVMKQYCSRYAWRLDRIWWKQALRLESEDGFLTRSWPQYATARLIEEHVPRESNVLAFNQTGEAYTSRNVIVSFQSAPGALLNDAIYTALLPDYQPVRRMVFQIDGQPLRAVRVRQTAIADPDLWSVSEFRVYSEGRELPRLAEWRLRANPNPWDVQLAFDNSSATRWRSWEAARPGMNIEVDFGRDTRVDSVALEMSRDQGKVRLELDGMDASGRWRTLVTQPVERETAPPLGLRREALEVVKSRGAGYLLVHENDWWAGDLVARSPEWGVTRLGETFGFRLYRID